MNKKHISGKYSFTIKRKFMKIIALVGYLFVLVKSITADIFTLRPLKYMKSISGLNLKKFQLI